MRGFVARTPALAGMVEVAAFAATCRGATLEVISSDLASSWGLKPRLVVCDEVHNWADTFTAQAFYESLSSSAAKTNAPLVCCSTPSYPAHWSHRAVYEVAKSDPAWSLVEIEGPPAWLDSGRLEEQRRNMPEASFERLYLGRWTAGNDQFATEADVAACCTLDGPVESRRGVSYMIGVDVAVKRDNTAVAVCHLEGPPRRGEPETEWSEWEAVGAEAPLWKVRKPVPVPERPVGQDGRVVVDDLRVWVPDGPANPVLFEEIEAAIVRLSEEYNNAQVWLDPWQALQLKERLLKRGVHAQEFAFSQGAISRLAVGLLARLRTRRIVLPNDPEFVDELRGVRLLETSPNVYRIDHFAGKHDDRVIAVALASHHAEQLGHAGESFTMKPRWL